VKLESTPKDNTPKHKTPKDQVRKDSVPKDPALEKVDATNKTAIMAEAKETDMYVNYEDEGCKLRRELFGSGYPKISNYPEDFQLTAPLIPISPIHIYSLSFKTFIRRGFKV